MTGKSESDSGKSPPKKAGDDLGPARTVLSEELLQGRQELLIEHAGETYRLRVTRKGKLILYK
ncbi:MAG: hemin uptake protein HemP [Planctomycetes bacterium]|nr:hemin uptake protein HemP [Planctomycetota bacterium]